MSIGEIAPIYSNFGGDPDMVDLVQVFVDEMPARIDHLAALVTSADWEQLGSFAHQMKGACGSYGFDQLSTVAFGVETAVRGGEPLDVVRTAAEELAISFGNAHSGTP